jgi:hypothetical protein
MKTTLFFIYFFTVLTTSAQIRIDGSVKDRKGEAISGANVYFEGAYEGASTGPDGSFHFSTELSGEHKLIVSFIGYTSYNQILNLSGKEITIQVILEETVNEMNEVVITAGAFEASDEKKSVLLKPFDIATTPSAQGDVFGALAALPGSQKVGESGKLFVRGGESYETKMFMDGMQVQSPYFTNMPDIPTRGRFSPLLFTGAVFSTGGYSAEYGQALSSVVAVKTTDLEPKDKTSISILTVGANASHVKRWKNTSLALSGEYINAALHNAIFKPSVYWIKAPVIADGNMMLRQKTGKNGMIKSFCTFYRNSLAMKYNNIELGRTDNISLMNNDLYFNTTYTDHFGDKWILNTGFAYSDDMENTLLTQDKVSTKTSTGNLKSTLTYFTSDKVSVKMGGEITGHRYDQKISLDGNYHLQFNNYLSSAFAESEINISKSIAMRVGARAEYNSYLNNLNMVPRISAAYKTGKYSQISMAYGKFYQNPQDDYLKFAPDLSSEMADHYILNYQYNFNQRTFRIESYYKNYFHLVKYLDKYSGDPRNYSNTGYGDAKGIDIFWRDQTTFKNSDYWISYSFIISGRNYKDYPVYAVPDFVSTQNFSFVYKRFFESIHSFFGFTYTYASGRPYNDPNSENFMAGKTKTYNDISFNFTYLTSVFKQQAIIHLMANNILGIENTYGYHFSRVPDSNGIYLSQPVTSPIRRQLVLGLIIMI